MNFNRKRGTFILSVILCIILLLSCGCKDGTESRSGDASVSGSRTELPADPVTSEPVPGTSADAGTDPVTGAEEITENHVHEFVLKETVAPGCETEGYTLYTCVCGESEKRQPVSPAGHRYAVKEVIGPTCTSKGCTVLACSCGSTVNTDFVPEVPHDFVLIGSTEADCVKGGNSLFRCSVCGSEKAEQSSPALGHLWKVVSESGGTCLIAGTRVSECERCGEKKSETTTVPKHDYVIERTVIPSATRKGYTVHICLCGDSYQDSFVKATGNTPAAAYSSEPITIPDARSGFVFDAEENKVYNYGKLDAQIYPASITKLVTALTAMEYAPDSFTVTVGTELGLVPSGSSLAGLRKGNKITLGQLYYALLLPSGCDAGYVIAQGVGRVIDPRATTDYAAVKVFIAEMNNWSRRAGMDGTNWANPDGNHDADHFTTMADLIKLAMICAGNDKLTGITSTHEYSVTLSGRTLLWPNSNGMLYLTDECFGLKTGNTPKAGYCLLSCYGPHDKPLVIGIFGCAKKDQRVSVTNLVYEQYRRTVPEHTGDIPEQTTDPGSVITEPVTGEPVTTDVPITSDFPVSTDTPEIPDTPVSTDTPVTPDTPVSTDSPVIPDTPVSTDSPVIPDTPVSTDNPVTPAPAEITDISDVSGCSEAPVSDGSP